MVITLGEKGSLAYDGKEIFFAPPVKTSVVDTIGAGDSHAGAVISARRFGLSWQEAITAANYVSAAVVAKEGGQLEDPAGFVKRINDLMLALSLGGPALAASDPPAPRATASDSSRADAAIDLPRFMGDWYVIASIPTAMERGANSASSREVSKQWLSVMCVPQKLWRTPSARDRTPSPLWAATGTLAMAAEALAALPSCSQRA